jgi:DNA-binding CsgD family transcriptional regulator
MTQEYKNEIVILLSQGMTARDSAAFLGVNYKTLETHIDIIKREYNCKNTTHLVATFIRKKLIQ